MIVAFDPAAIQLERINDDFVHALSTQLEGRLVVKTNSRGMFLQVGLEIPPAPTPLIAQSLDMSQQATPWHMPIGMTKDGPLWLSLIEEDSYLIGGSRRKGKSGLTHGMIQALLRGGQTEVYGWDGKGGLEFGRYIDHPDFHYMHDAERGLMALTDEVEARKKKLFSSGHTNIISHNKAGKDFIKPIALFLDEIALLDDLLKVAVKRMIEYGGAYGVYPVLATNDPIKASILVKTNLSTRICFAVPSFNDSITVLGMKGAEALHQVGRGFILFGNQLTEFQSFTVEYPDFDEPKFLRYIEQLSAQVEGKPAASSESAEKALSAEAGQPDEITRLAESIRAQWSPELSGRAVGQLLGKPYGGSWHKKVNEIMDYLRATSATATTVAAGAPDLDPKGA